MASLLWGPPWDRAFGVTDCQETLWPSVWNAVLSAYPWGFPGAFPWGGVLRCDREAGGWERRADSRCSSRVRQSPVQSLGCSVQEKVEAEATLCTVLSQEQSEGAEDSTSGRERSQTRKTQTTKSHRRVSQCQKFQLWHYLELPWTDRHVGKTDGALCFGFRKSKSRICHSVCYVQQYCTVHFINEMLPATVQH